MTQIYYDEEWIRFKGNDADEAFKLKLESKSAPPKFALGDLVFKVKGSQWRGRVVGTYSTELTPDGYVIESESHKGSCQIYPAQALEKV